MLGRLRGSHRSAALRTAPPSGMLEALRDGAVPLAPGAAQAAGSDRLSVAFVIPPFRRGSGGHGAIAYLIRGLEERGHDCELIVLDDEGRHAAASEDEVGRQFREWFGPLRAPVRADFGGWSGADLTVATGWQTVPAVLRAPATKARAYLVQDHEPEFYATSIEREWAAWTYRQGLHHIASSTWLGALLTERYGASASTFAYGIDHDTYAVRDGGARRADTVLFYARPTTPRRAVPLGLLALEELVRRRPQVQVELFGEAAPLQLAFPARQLGVLDDRALSSTYAQATVGLVLSLTNPSLVPLEMLGCGLPVVDLASESMRTEFGPDGPIVLADAHPIALCEAIEALLDDPAARADRSRRGTELMVPRTFAAAADGVEAGLREALRRAPAM